jgi:oxalate decarboxylase
MTSEAKEVLAENLGVSEDDFADSRAHEVSRFQTQVPGPLLSGQIPDPNGAVARSFSHRPTMDAPPIISIRMAYPR